MLAPVIAPPSLFIIMVLVGLVSMIAGILNILVSSRKID
jgi:hypothetical protein